MGGEFNFLLSCGVGENLRSPLGFFLSGLVEAFGLGALRPRLGAKWGTISLALQIYRVLRWRALANNVAFGPRFHGQLDPFQI